MYRKGKYLLILLIILIMILINNNFHVEMILSLDNLKEKKDILMKLVEKNYMFSVILYIFFYFSVVSLSLPGAAVLSIAGGFMFGTLLGSLYINIGASFGASVIFFLIRFFLGNDLLNKYEKQMKKVNKELDENGINYLLTIRLIPVFPFFLVNILLGLTNISFTKFFITTALGIIPGSVVYTFAGKNLRSISEMGDILKPNVITGLIILGIFALIPVFIKKLKIKNKK